MFLVHNKYITCMEGCLVGRSSCTEERDRCINDHSDDERKRNAIVVEVACSQAATKSNCRSVVKTTFVVMLIVGRTKSQDR